MFQGYRTTIGAIGLVLAGVARIATSIGNDFSWDEISAGFAAICMGLAAFGIGSKIDRK